MNKVMLKPQDWRAYEVYGYCNTMGNTAGLLGFNGVRVDESTGNYALGDGYRLYDPRLMRFQSPDRLCPFGRGGVNAYAYCLGDPVNRTDPSGQFSLRRTWQAWTGGPKSVTSLSRLKNTNAHRLFGDIKTTEYNLRRGFASLELVTPQNPLTKLLNASSSYTHKWLVTKHGELVVGSFNHAKAYSTHASFANLAAKRFDTSSAVVAAGEFKIKKGNIVMTNYSGHYKTPYNRLWPVKMHIETLAEGVKIVRRSYLADVP
jgi:RHS repeat-associated protein